MELKLMYTQYTHHSIQQKYREEQYQQQQV